MRARQVSIPHHARNVQVFDNQNLASIHERLGGLVDQVSAGVSHPTVKSRAPRRMQRGEHPGQRLVLRPPTKLGPDPSPGTERLGQESPLAAGV